MVHAELPNRFHQRSAAQEELAWCVKNVEKAPHPAWLREGYYQMAKLGSADGDHAKSQEYLRRSGQWWRIVWAIAALLKVPLTVAFHLFKKPFIYAGFNNLTTDGHGFHRRKQSERTAETMRQKDLTAET